MKGHWSLTAIYKNPDNRAYPKSETLDYYHKTDLVSVISKNISKDDVDIYVITKIEDKKISTHSEPVQRAFKSVKEGQKFIDDMVKFTETNHSFFHYNFEEIQAVLLESRGKITRDNQIKSEIQSLEQVK